MINESFDLNDTPNKKRKRDNGFSVFTSSTPIKANKENFMDFMEIKSIAELVVLQKSERNTNTKPVPTNEYEVIRKPPKKKKKADDGCFVNPGLDLKVDEKVINPFEVVRRDNTAAIKLAQGFENPALDFGAIESSNQLTLITNPFEVFRDSKVEEVSACASMMNTAGIDNTALELNPPVHTPMMLSLPFTPTVNHRIDFSNMPDNMTPCSMFSAKLVIDNECNAGITTPKKIPIIKPRKSLSVISEEIEIDIGEELDCYQLQLENSINEAKLKNRKYSFDSTKTIAQETTIESLKSSTFIVTKDTLMTIEESKEDAEEAEEEIKNEESIPQIDNDDVQFEEVDSEDDFEKLGQFKRAYRTEPLKINKLPLKPMSGNIKKPSFSGSIRRSIRKLISHPLNERSSETSEDKPDSLFSTIRQSLRRRAKPKTIVVQSLDSSIMGRQVFREKVNTEAGKRTLERTNSIKKHVVKSMKSFQKSVEEFDRF